MLSSNLKVHVSSHDKRKSAKMQGVNCIWGYDEGMNMQDGLTFGDWLRDELDDRGWRQEDLAIQVGVDPSTVSNWANDQTKPQPGHCDGIARVWGIDRNEVRTRAGRRPIIQRDPVRIHRELPDPVGFDQLTVRERIAMVERLLESVKQDIDE